MRRNILISLLVCLSGILNAQEIFVENGSTGEPAENVAIYNQDKSRSILTNLEGFVSLENFKPNDTLFFQHPSYIGFVIPLSDAVRKRKIVLERKNVLLPEFVITASKHLENQHDIAYMVDVLSPKTLERIPSQNSADILSTTGNIFIQKSQVGGGSPILRGFEANKVLLVIDGIRMNNAIYRSGHLQNSLTIDNAILDRAEIIYGPSSVIYGSDALGGVIHYITRDPELSDSLKQPKLKISAYTQAASGVGSFKNHLDVNIGGTNFASLSSITYGKFGNIRLGGRRDPFIGEWGLQKWNVQRTNNLDSVLQNSETNKLLNAYYNQTDVLQKFRFRPNSYFDLTVNLQYSESSNLNRHDELNNIEDNLPEFSEWYYGPQKRFLSSINAKLTANSGIYSSLVATAGYQEIEESRNTRNFKADTLFHQVEKVSVYSANLDLIKFLYGRNSINYGLELNHNQVGSDATKRNITNGAELPALSRYPDKGTKTLNAGAYLSFKTYLTNKLIASVGGRYQYYYLSGKYGEMYNDLPDIFTDVKLKNHALTGSFSLIYDQYNSLNWNFILSTGFRSPNLDDLAKIRVASGKLTLPNSNLKPENSYNAELGLSKTYDGYIQLNGKYFISYLSDAIVRETFMFDDGADTVWFQGRYRNAFVNVNSSEAILHGFNLNIVSDFNSNISLKSTLNYTYGKNITKGTPLAHVPPIFGRTDLSYEVKKLIVQVYFYYAGWKRNDEMALTGEDKHEEATEHGFPGWYTINFNSNYRLNSKINFQLAIENLTDNFYHPFASGVPAPGINFVGTIRVNL